MKTDNWLVSLCRVLTTPSCWIQNFHYSPEWDAELNRLMKVERFKNITHHTASIGKYQVWVANHPYASFTPTLANHISCRPSRATILRAKRKLMADLFSTEND